MRTTMVFDTIEVIRWSRDTRSAVGRLRNVTGLEGDGDLNR